MCAIDICIPKMDARVTEMKIRKGIESKQIGKVTRYKELYWKNDSSNKRIMMCIDWNKEHSQYTQMRDRLEKGENIKIVNDTEIWHVYKNEQVSSWQRGVKV